MDILIREHYDQIQVSKKVEILKFLILSELETKKAYTKTIKFVDESEFKVKFAKTFRAYTIDIYKVC